MGSTLGKAKGRDERKGEELGGEKGRSVEGTRRREEKMNERQGKKRRARTRGGEK